MTTLKNLIIEDKGSYIVTWDDLLADFFRLNKIYLGYPWKLDGIYKKGDKFRIPKACFAERYSNMPKGRILSFGAFSYSRTSNMALDFSCGRYCSFATNISLSSYEHPLDRVSSHPLSTHPHMRAFASDEFGKDVLIEGHRFIGKPPVIENDVWIGDDVQIKRGVRIGTGAVIANRAFVTKDVPPYAIVGGLPANIIRFRFDESKIERLLQSKWWEYNYADFPQISTKNVDKFLDVFEEKVLTGEIVKFTPGIIDVSQELIAFINSRF